jgi:polysaccharide export outer membrane protein
VLLAATCALAGCQTEDTRLSWQEVQHLEYELNGASEPNAVQVADLAPIETRPLAMQPGDIIQFTLLERNGEHGQSTVRARVHSDGTITLPLPGKIHVADLDLEGVEQAVVEAHVPKYLKRLAVFAELLDSEPTTVIVAGPGGQHGVVELPRNERNVLYALAKAGGIDALSGTRVTVHSNDPERPESDYDLTCVEDIRRALAAAPLQSGDVLSVSAAESSVIYAVGLFNNPGPIPVPRGSELSLMQTVASAGGIVDFLDPPEATLWRRLADGRTVRARIELREILVGRAPDIALRPGDILDIPHSAETRFRQWFSENITIGPFGLTAVWDPMADRRAALLRDDYNDKIYRTLLLDSLQRGFLQIVQPQP